MVFAPISTQRATPTYPVQAGSAEKSDKCFLAKAMPTSHRENTKRRPHHSHRQLKHILLRCWLISISARHFMTWTICLERALLAIKRSLLIAHLRMPILPKDRRSMVLLSDAINSLASMVRPP